MTCPHCTTAILLADLRGLTDVELRSIRGLVSLALRKAPPLPAGPGRGHKGPHKRCEEVRQRDL